MIALFVAAAVSSLAGQAPLLDSAPVVGRGVSRQLAEWRARTVRGVAYDIALDVTSLDSAVGRVTVRFQRVGAGGVILDFRGRRLGRAVANGRPLAARAADGWLIHG